MIIKEEQHPADRQNAPFVSINNTQISTILRDIGTTPLNSLNSSILPCKTGILRQLVQSSKLLISLQVMAKQNRYEIAIEKLKYEETKPILFPTMCAAHVQRLSHKFWLIGGDGGNNIGAIWRKRDDIST
jgi:hypothetical protein